MDITSATERPALGTSIILGLLLLILTVVLLLSAWLCDDAYITFRTIENIIAGNGPRWNVIERVQSFTHPLWLLLITGVRALTGEVYYSSIFTSLALSLGSVFLLLRLTADRARIAPVLLVVLLFSRSFIDYSTSGLENPLSHFLVLLFFGIWFRIEKSSADCEFMKLWLLASGILLCRLDLLLLIAPALLSVAIMRRDSRGLILFVVGFSPLILWEVFSVVYYGVPVPNTAYAKLGADVSLSKYIYQGCLYLWESARFDPAAVTAILLGFVSGFLSRERKQIIIAIGIALYLLYVIRIGGDFMAGRFLTVPLLASLILLGRRTGDSWRYAGVALAGFVVLGFLSYQPTLLTGRNFGLKGEGVVTPSGVTDERGFYFPTTGLFRSGDRQENIQHEWAERGRKAGLRGQKIHTTPTVGFYGYFAGPGVHIIDKLALCDPLLARLEVDPDEPWRIGHFFRIVPAGYPESVLQPVSGIQDPDIAALDDRIRLVTRGPLFSADRWKAIVELNLD